MLNKVLNFLFETSSPSLRKKQIRTLWVAILLGVLAAAIIGALLYLLNRQGRL